MTLVEIVRILCIGFFFEDISDLANEIKGNSTLSTDAIKNNLNTFVKLDTDTPQLSTTIINNYGSNIISTLENKNDKIDVFYYYSAYTKVLGEHFIDLRNVLSEELGRYDEEIIKNACTSNDGKIVGLPLYLFGYGLLANNDYLTLYQKRMPKTWDELMETAKYICKKEKEEHNNSLVPIKIPLKDESSGSSVFYSFINSFRESNNSTYPKLNSKATKDALKKLKDLKDEVGIDIEAQANDSFFFPTDAIFMINLVSPYSPNIIGSSLPGNKEGVSGTVIISHNLGINKYIDKKRKEKSIEFLKYVALKEIQMKC